MKRSLKRLSVVGATAAMTLGLAVALPASPASADSSGWVKAVPASGDADSAFAVQASDACPATAPFAGLVIYGGPNNWAPAPDAPFLISPNDVVTDYRSPMPTGFSIKSAATTGKGLPLAAGTYNLQLICYADADGTVVSTFDSQLTLTADATKMAGYRYDMVAVAAPASAVTLTAPATAAAGTPVNLSANVTAAATMAGTTTGTVDFKDGATTIASAPVAGLTNAAAGVTVTAPATFTTGGAHSITAVFTPADAAVVMASTSAASTVNVTVPAVATATALTVPATATSIEVVTLSATVTPHAAGTVTFKEGATTVGSGSVNTATGVATASVTGLSAGAHSYTAEFVPTDSAAYIGSTSSAATVTVTAFAGYNLNGVLGEGENITATVDAGTLTITAAKTPVNLGTLVLNSSNDRLVNAAATNINPVTITDTRAGQLGYTVSGSAGDFASGANAINSENLGWTPALGTVPATINITAGPAIAAGDGLAVGAVTGAGLKTSRVLATSVYDSATNKGSVGTVDVTAGLNIKAPTTTKPGVYSTTLVITAI